ncbi:hypothetical protein HOE22_05460 [Candidatus Woesearchaeota archaeon]|jgi:Zn finger protein HypA/HybF involved in hydrogenase expression|nr:hypothetical protein [Candidatus Woesearchaeota archaeon]MBT4732865.1 hypothetical protein [Candidatus Woesearchaeota archaeon]MBT6050813.1 hypothetical protein [Candidatus Scalindua sp.]MBT6227844.1 hypothetical protein [Candidatus Scalindua sp.]
MGSIISAHCDCGYVVEMPLGGGMRSFNERSNFPFYCEECRILFEANAFEEPVSCPKCKGSETVTYDRKCLQEGTSIFKWGVGDRVLILTNGKHICPKCGKNTLTFEDAGCWD